MVPSKNQFSHRDSQQHPCYPPCCHPARQAAEAPRLSPWLGCPMSSASGGGACRSGCRPPPPPPSRRRQGWKEQTNKQKGKPCDFLSNGLRHYSAIVQLMVLFTLLCKAKQTYSWWLAGLRGLIHTSGLNLNPVQ